MLAEIWISILDNIVHWRRKINLIHKRSPNPLSFFRQRTQYGNRYSLVCEAERSKEENQSRRDAREGCSVTDGQREAPPDSDGSLPECNAYVTTANNSRNNTTAVCCALLSSRNTYTALGK